MATKHKIAVAIMSLLFPLIAATTATAAPQAIDAWDDQTGAALAPWDCTIGNVCFWNNFNGTGSRCMWGSADPNWTTAPGVCSWTLTSSPKSVWNRGQRTDLTGVAYYRDYNYDQFYRCTRQGLWENIEPPVRIRSHRWIDTTCL